MSFKTTQRCCYVGYIVQATVINFLPLLFVIFKNEYNLTYALLGTLVSVNFITQLFVDIVSVFFLERIGYRKSAVAANLFSAAGLALLAFLPDIMPPFLGVCIGTVLYSVGGGLIEVVINPIISGLPEECGGNFVLTHSFYSWGQLSVVLFTTIALRIFGENSWNIISLCWALIPLINGIVFIKTPIAPPVAEKERGKISIFGNKTFLAMLILMICAGGSEIAMAQWASTFAQDALGVDKAVGDLMGPCLFAFFMGIGRLFYGINQDKINYRRFMTANCILCIICYLAAALSQNPFVSLAGCAVCGFAISTMWPGVIEFAAKNFPSGGGAMYSAIAIFGDIGCSVAPFLTGLVASMSLWGENALRVGLGINIIYPLGFIVTLMSIRTARATTTN